MKCTYCDKEIKLVPSAAERAKRFGGKPSDYTKLFTMHAECQVSKREAETKELLKPTSIIDAMTAAVDCGYFDKKSGA